MTIPAHVAHAGFDAFFAGAASMQNCDGVVITVQQQVQRDVLLQVADEGRRIPRRGQHAQAQRRWKLARRCVGRVGMIAALRDAGCQPEGRRALLVGPGGAGGHRACAGRSGRGIARHS